MKIKKCYPHRGSLVQGLISEQSFTLIGGCSGAAKSRLIYQCLEEWLQSSTLLGYQCYRVPTKFRYYAFDRLIGSVWEDLNSMAICFDPEHVEIHSAVRQTLTDKEFKFPQVGLGEVVILDGLDMLAQDVKDFRIVKELCHQCTSIIESHGISIIGMIGGVKTLNKPSGSKSNPLDQLLGSGVWQRVSDTNMVLEIANLENMNGRRILHVRPRAEGAGGYFRMLFEFDKDTGRLVPAADSATVDRPDQFYGVLPDRFRTEEAVELGTQLMKSRRTVYNWIDYLVERAWIEKIHHGMFQKKRKSN